MANEHSNPSQRVVITGLGVVSPIGSDLDSLWKSLEENRTGISPLESLPTAALPVKSGAEVKDFSGAISDYGELEKPLQRAIKKNMKVMCREIEMGVAAAQKAIQHSRLDGQRDPQRCGCLFGCDYILSRPEEYADGLRACHKASGEFRVADWPKYGLGQVNPLWLLKYLPNMPNSHVSIYNDFRGPNNSLTVREASMNLAVAEAASIIRRGAADVMLVGATGSRVHPLRTTHAALNEPLASEQDEPGRMARPFDRTCDGMVLGEGAGALMLESWEHAQARGAEVWGEIIGHGAAMCGPRDPAGQARDYLRLAIGSALRAARRAAEDRLPQDWHFHAQGLSSPEPDQSEALAISDFLGKDSGVAVTAAKSFFGNLGAGGAAVELICSLLALRQQRLFPIRNLKTPVEGVSWRPVSEDATTDARPGQARAGQAFFHSSFTLQGQASCLVIAAA